MGYLSQVSSVIEDVTGKSAISLNQFAKDYSRAFACRLLLGAQKRKIFRPRIVILIAFLV